MWNLERTRVPELETSTAEDAEAVDARCFVASLEQPLQADADSQERRAIVHHCLDRRPPVAGEGLGGVEVAHAGHDDAVGAAEFAGDRRRPHVGADRGQGLADRRQVAGAIVNQCNHSKPFVLGKVRDRRLSFEHATRSARANALKHASIL